METKKVIHTDGAPAAIGPYSQGVMYGNLLFTAGQIPIDLEVGAVIEGDITVQTRLVMHHLRAILKEAGMDFSNVIKATVFLQNMSDFKAMNDEYASYFPPLPPVQVPPLPPPPYPAREAIQAAALPKGVLVEISMIAGI